VLEVVVIARVVCPVFPSVTVGLAIVATGRLTNEGATNAESCTDPLSPFKPVSVMVDMLENPTLIDGGERPVDEREKSGRVDGQRFVEVTLAFTVIVPDPC
jgi:hypothetical protein